MRWVVENLVDLREIDVRMLEESHADFDGKNLADHFVNICFLDLAGFHEGFEIVEVGLAVHVHVNASTKTAIRGVLGIAGKAMGDQILDRIGIADDKSFKSEIV